MIGTTFYTSLSGSGTHTDALHLIQTSVEVAPAPVRTKFLTVPHRNGQLDLTDYLGYTEYDNREIKWEFTVSPGEDYAAVRRAVESTLNGKRLYIVIDEEPGHAYYGRVTVNSFARDRVLYKITVSASCDPERLVR